MQQVSRFRLLWCAGLVLSVLTYAATNVQAQQLTPEQMATMILNSASKGYNEKNYPFARDRFREFLQKFGGHKDANLARYGLALVHIEGPEKNWNEARELLQAASGQKELAEHPSILYYLGYSIRAQGLAELEQAIAKPQEAPQRMQTAMERFSQAAPVFAGASAAYQALVKDVAADKPLPTEAEWAARARCDQAEMLLRTQKLKETVELTQPFLKDAVLTRSKYVALGRYYHGHAAFLLNDLKTAEIALSLVAPFSDPLFGTHARYLLARCHHLGGEKAEATQHYEGVLKDYAQNKQKAIEIMKNGGLIQQLQQKDPVELVRIAALAKEPPPEYVARTTFYQGVLQYEAGRFGEARTLFLDHGKLYPTSPMLQEAELRAGFCSVQMKDFPDALKRLEPLVAKEPRLADQAQYWLAKAVIGSADPSKEPAYTQALQAGINHLNQAAEKANGNKEADAKERRGEILLEAGDTLQTLKQYKEALNRYQTVVNEKLLAPRQEEIAVRIITALHLDGQYDVSDQQVAKFRTDFAKSTLLPVALFRHAENQYFRALAAEKKTDLPNRQQELAKLYDETAKRYLEVVTKYPELPQISLARYGLAMAHYRKGDLDKARELFDTIPATDRNGELAIVSYIIADCLLRQAPNTLPDDALAAGKLESQLKSSVQLLEAFVAAAEKAPQVPDALIKLGLCHQRMAGLLVQPQEKTAALNSARGTYERLLKPEYAKEPQQAQAIMERAKCIALTGDIGNAMNELRRFQGEPLKNAAVAPMANLYLATLLRQQNKAADAAVLLAQARGQYEQSLSNDPVRSSWIPLLRYHHGIALRESGKLKEARDQLELVVKQAPDRAEAADAALRWAQCLKDEALLQVDAANKAQGAAKKPEEVAAVQKLREDAYAKLRDAGKYLESSHEQFKQKQATPDIGARMFYEAAWIYRLLAELEVAQARQKVLQELIAKHPETSKFQTPEVAPGMVPLQPAEKRAREMYQALFAAYGDQALASDARFECAEMLADRAEHDEAIKLLGAALDAEPPQELADRIRIRLGACHAAKGNLAGALAQFDAVANNPKSEMVAQAHYRASEVLLTEKKYADAAKRLAIFRDNGQFQNVPGVSDRALLRLGHAFAHLKDWNGSKQAHEVMLQRFGGSPWVQEARYGMGWALQNLGQFDPAVNVYAQVTQTTANETAAKAQLQIGLCRLEQKKYPEAATALLVVPFTYSYPELSAVALLEASRAYTELKQPLQAQSLLRQIVERYPGTRWAEVAGKQLEAQK